MWPFQKAKSAVASRSSRYKYFIHNNTFHERAATLAQIIKAQDRLVWLKFCDLFCRDTSFIRGRSIFFLLVYFSSFFKNRNVYSKKENRAVEATKSNCLSWRSINQFNQSLLALKFALGPPSKYMRLTVNWKGETLE